MDKTTFFVIQEQNKENGKMFAYAEKVHNCYNLYKYFHPCNGYEITSINAVSTYKKAKQTADFWNECAKKNNNYAFA